MISDELKKTSNDKNDKPVSEKSKRKISLRVGIPNDDNSCNGKIVIDQIFFIHLKG